MTLALLFSPSTTPLDSSFLGAEIVEDEFAMIAERAGDFLHGLNAGAHSLPAPLIEELARPRRRVVFPELLEGFPEKVGSDGLEVVAEEIAESELLFVFEILTAFEQQPAGFLEDRVAALASHAARFLGAHLVKRLVHIGEDMEAVEDMQSLGASFTDELQVWFPAAGPLP